MPKKKFTKKQTKRLLNVVRRNLYKLMIDRLEHGTKSEVKITFDKLKQFRRTIANAEDKL